jgi:hypothetical protein
MISRPSVINAGPVRQEATTVIRYGVCNNCSVKYIDGSLINYLKQWAFYVFNLYNTRYDQRVVWHKDVLVAMNMRRIVWHYAETGSKLVSNSRLQAIQ